MDKNIVNNTILLQQAARSKKYEDIEDEVIGDIEDIKLNLSDIKSVNSMVSDKLTYNFYFKHKEILYQLFDRMEQGEYESYKDISKELKKQLSSLLSEIQKVETMESNQSFFSLSEGIFESMVTRAVKKAQAPSTYLKTKIQYLNRMLNNGFESGRVYMFLGLTGGKLLLPIVVILCKITSLIAGKSQWDNQQQIPNYKIRNKKKEWK